MVISIVIIAILTIAFTLYIVQSMRKSSDLTYWQSYRMNYPQKAFDIESLTGINFDYCSDIDAMQIISSIERWSSNTGLDISLLKENYLSSMMELLNEGAGLTIDYMLSDLRNKQLKKEADTYNIKEENTICRFMIEILEDFKHDMERLKSHENLSERFKDQLINMLAGWDDILPEDSDGDEVEGQLFKLAEECVDRLSDEFRPLDILGRSEALLFFSTLIINLGEMTDNEDSESVEGRYKQLLHDELMIAFDADDFYPFVNDRIRFYKGQYQKMKTNKRYTPMFIYNALYMNPGCNAPDHLKEFNESPLTLLEMQAKLYELEHYINEQKDGII